MSHRNPECPLHSVGAYGVRPGAFHTPLQKMHLTQRDIIPMKMTDTAKATIIAFCLTIAIGIFGIMLRTLSLFLLGLISGPGLLVQGVLDRFLYGFLLWLTGAIVQYITIYFMSLWIYRRPKYWKFNTAVLAVAWIVTGILGWMLVK
jgi:hypothetical protein